MVLSRVHFLDALELLGGFFLADDALTLTVLDVAHDLLVGRALLLVLLTLLSQLKLQELLLLTSDRLVFLPSLSRKLESLLGSTRLDFKLTDTLRTAHLLFFLRNLKVLNVFVVLLFDKIIVALSLS